MAGESAGVWRELLEISSNLLLDYRALPTDMLGYTRVTRTLVDGGDLTDDPTKLFLVPPDPMYN